MDVSTLHSHSSVDNLVLSFIPGRYATVQDIRDTKGHSNREGKVFESRAKTRSKVAIKSVWLHSEELFQLLTAVTAEVTSKKVTADYHSNLFCLVCHYPLKITAKDRCSFNCSMFLSPVRGKIQTKNSPFCNIERR